MFIMERMDIKKIHVESHGIRSNIRRNKMNTKLKLMNTLILLFFTTILALIKICSKLHLILGEMHDCLTLLLHAT
jgi:hypothetical protein